MYVSGISSSGAYVDATAPTISNSLPWGTYNAPKTVTLTASDNADTTPTIYYRLNQGAWSSATKTVSLTMGEGRTWLDYYAGDDSGNRAPTYSWYYTIDMDGPTVTASPTGSCYNSSKLVSLIASDNFDTNPTIYYTLNGSDPSSSSLRYSSPLNITNTTTLNFLAIDNMGNVGPVSSEVYTIGNPVVNVNTGKTYSKIQDALDDVLTLNGHVIQMYSATFLENVVINKNVTLMAASDVVVNALNSSLPVFTVNSNGSGSTISGLNLIGAVTSMGIYLNYAHDCLISGNNLMGNQHGIYLVNSSNNKIIKNTADGNSWFGIGVTYGSNNNSIFYNTLTNNGHEGIGLYRQSNYNKIYNNNASNNVFGVYVWDESNYNSLQCNVFNENEYGLFITNSSFNANFNTIVNNVNYGIIKKGTGTVNATNNWWGRSPVVASTVGSDIYVESGIVNFNPWFTSNIGFTSDQIINASLYVKNYIESNHQLPSSVNISGIQVNMPQFLKLAAQSVVNADSGLDDLIVLGDYGAVPGHVENMTDDELDSEYVSIADEILDYMDLNRNVPSNISNTSLGDTMSFESLVYMYSRILGYYSCDNNTLPDSISINPWIAVSNPNKVYNFRTQKVFNSIQSAIDDVDTIADDVISLWDGNYLENVIVNKTVTIESLDDNVTVNALNTSLPVFTINTLGSGSIIQNICINGSLTNSGIYINNSFNNTIFKNLITSNGNGIRIYNSTDNEISSNLISNNTLNGIFVYLGGNNTIYCNNLTYNGNGIVLNNSINNTIRINLLSKNLLDGIGIVDSSAVVSFNVISQNGRYGLYNQGNSTVDAQNNWWGSNNPSMSANGPSDIYNSSGTLNCDKWIVMNVNSTCDRSNRTGACYNYVITADLTHNNQGNDTSDDGNIPDGMPVTFVTNVGTISNGYTRNGKSVSNLNSSAAGLADVSATLNNQTNNISVNVTSINVFCIYNNRTQEGFTTIQGAINDNDTLNGDIIILNDGFYAENVVLNKTVTIKPADSSLVTITGADLSLAIFTITSSGSGSVISGLTLTGSEACYAIFLNATTNCNICGNVISGSDSGIYLFLSNNNTIRGNSLIDTNYGLVLYNSTNNILSGNYLTGNDYGIYLGDSNYNLIIENNATDNWDAINLFTSINNSILNNTIIGSWIGNYIYLSNNTVISGNNFEENGVGICYYDSNNTTFSGNNFTGNWIKDVSEIDSSNMVVATTIYTCGPAALATLMMHLGLNTTEKDLSNLAGTDNTGTSMYGLVQAANAKNLTAYGLKLSISQLKTDYIVVLSINDNNHYVIIQNITNTTAYLIDPNLGNIEMNLTNFTNTYTGYALVINNNTEINGTLLDNDTMKTIKGTDWLGAVVKWAKKTPIYKAAKGFVKWAKSTPTYKKTRKVYHSIRKLGNNYIRHKYNDVKKSIPYPIRKGIKNTFKTITAFAKNPTSPIKKTYAFLKNRQTYLIVDSINAVAIAIGYASSVSVWLAPVAAPGAMLAEGQLAVSIRNHYVPSKYWQYSSYHAPMWEAKIYTAVNIKTHYCDSFEVKKRPDGSLNWNEIIYISGTNGARKITLSQLKKLNKNLDWGYGKCPIPK